jgi:hypothetical protein
MAEAEGPVTVTATVIRPASAQLLVHPGNGRQVRRPGVETQFTANSTHLEINPEWSKENNREMDSIAVRQAALTPP